MMNRIRAAVGRWLCRRGRHKWSVPVPLDRMARDSRRPGKAKWTRICLRARADGALCGAKRAGYMRRSS